MAGFDVGVSVSAKTFSGLEAILGHCLWAGESRFPESTNAKLAMATVRPSQFEISIDGVPRTYRDRQDIAVQTARFLKSRNPHSVVKLKDLHTGEETVVAFKSE